jgi:signal transduction histidine kinase
MKPVERPLGHTAPKRPRILASPSAPPDEQPLIVVSLPPSTAQKILAAATSAALFAAFVVVAGPLGGLRLPHVDAFIPACGAAMFVTAAITAALLFVQFEIIRSRALLLVACGYLFTALIVIPWMLTFPGVFAPDGILGASLQTTPWLSLIWHAGFPLFVIAYALLHYADPAAPTAQAPHRPGFAVGSASLTVIAAVVAATLLTTLGIAALPPLLREQVHLTVAWQYLSAGAVLLTLLALALLWRRLRSVLDLWLMVVLCAYVMQILLVSFPAPARFTIGWYAGLLFGLLSCSLVLIVLLVEITALYARLLNALRAQRREREARLLTGNAIAAMIAHEIKQPLTGITVRAQAGLRWLDRPEPEIDEAREAFRQIANNGLRTSQKIDSVRTAFRCNAQSRISLAPDSLIADVLACLSADLQHYRISVHTESEPDLPDIAGDPAQLRQGLVNLVTNAIDAMAETTGPRILSIYATFRDGSVRISVADNGPGIRPEDADCIFNPLFTTKPDGMGMGLAICRSIIQNHDGRLWVAPNTPQGAVFHVALRAAGA